MRELKGKVAIVTGAAGGIGQALSLALARQGTHLALLDKSFEATKRLAHEAARLGVRTLAVDCDLERLDDLGAVCRDLIGHFGAVDLLVNNAGCCYFGPTARMTAEQWRRVMTVNLLAPTRLVHELLPHLVGRPEAHILNIASIYGLVVTRRCAAYHASKYGLVGLSEALRCEMIGTQLGVTTVCPSFVDTGFFNATENGRPDRPMPRPPRWAMTTPERVAAKSIAGIRRNRRLVLVHPLAYVWHYTARYFPAGLWALHKYYGWKSVRRAQWKAAQAALMEAASPTLRVAWHPEDDSSGEPPAPKQDGAPPSRYCG